MGSMFVGWKFEFVWVWWLFFYEFFYCFDRKR